MRKIAILIAFLFSFIHTLSAQENNQPIEYEKAFLGYRFYQSQEQLNYNQLAGTLQTNPQAYQQLKSAKNINMLGSTVAGVGGALFGYTLGYAITGSDPNWAMAGIGAGLIFISLPITNSASKKVRDAVDTYNSGLQSASMKEKSRWQLSLTQNGAGLVFQF